MSEVINQAVEKQFLLLLNSLLGVAIFDEKLFHATVLGPHSSHSNQWRN